MQHLTSHVKDGYSKSTVTMVTLIYLQPSNETCIYSTLPFVKNKSKNLNVDVPCITFDQPLWYKANKIVNDKNVVMTCRLGDFHTLMSFLGSIGTYIVGSSIEQALDLIYARNTEKVCAGAIISHILFDSVIFWRDILKHTTTHNQPTTTHNHPQPASNHPQPPTTSQQPATTSQQPATTSHNQPTTMKNGLKSDL